MGKSLWIILLLFAAIIAPNAHADDITDYTINFTGGGVPPFEIGPEGLPTGTIVYDASVQSITASMVWDGYDFELPDAVLTNGITPSPGCTGATTAALALAYLGGCGGSVVWRGDAFSPIGYVTLYVGDPDTTYFAQFQPPFDINQYLINGDVIDGGELTITPTVATPEPGTGSLMLIGIGMVLMVVVAQKKTYNSGHSTGTGASSPLTVASRMSG
jgi:hypothetical protein